MTYRMPDALTDALAEIERLRASCIEYRAELSEQDSTIKRLQEQLAELKGGPKALSKAERDGIIAEWEAGDL